MLFKGAANFEVTDVKSAVEQRHISARNGKEYGHGKEILELSESIFN